MASRKPVTAKPTPDKPKKVRLKREPRVKVESATKYPRSARIILRPSGYGLVSTGDVVMVVYGHALQTPEAAELAKLYGTAKSVPSGEKNPVELSPVREYVDLRKRLGVSVVTDLLKDCVEDDEFGWAVVLVEPEDERWQGIVSAIRGKIKERKEIAKFAVEDEEDDENGLYFLEEV